MAASRPVNSQTRRASEPGVGGPEAVGNALDQADRVNAPVAPRGRDRSLESSHASGAPRRRTVRTLLYATLTAPIRTESTKTGGTNRVSGPEPDRLTGGRPDLCYAQDSSRTGEPSRHEPAAHDRREDLGRPRRRPGAGRAGRPRGRPPPRPRGHVAAGVLGPSRPRPRASATRSGPSPPPTTRSRPIRAACRWPTRWPRPRSTS